MSKLESFSDLTSDCPTVRGFYPNLNRINLLQLSKMLNKERFVIWMPLHEIVPFNSQALQVIWIYFAELFDIFELIMAD